jgi:hypothetical protein
VRDVAIKYAAGIFSLSVRDRQEHLSALCLPEEVIKRVFGSKFNSDLQGDVRSTLKL